MREKKVRCSLWKGKVPCCQHCSLSSLFVIIAICFISAFLLYFIFIWCAAQWERCKEPTFVCVFFFSFSWAGPFVVIRRGTWWKRLVLCFSRFIFKFQWTRTHTQHKQLFSRDLCEKPLFLFFVLVVLAFPSSFIIIWSGTFFSAIRRRLQSSCFVAEACTLFSNFQPLHVQKRKHTHT